MKLQKTTTYVPWHPGQGSALQMGRTQEGNDPEFWTQPATELLCDFELVP